MTQPLLLPAQGRFSRAADAATETVVRPDTRRRIQNTQAPHRTELNETTRPVSRGAEGEPESESAAYTRRALDGRTQMRSGRPATGITEWPLLRQVALNSSAGWYRNKLSTTRTDDRKPLPRRPLNELSCSQSYQQHCYQNECRDVYRNQHGSNPDSVITKPFRHMTMTANSPTTRTSKCFPYREAAVIKPVQL